jgi:hypothetical protein
MPHDILSVPSFGGGGTAYLTTRPMAGGTQRQSFGLFCTHQNIRSRAHCAADQNWLADASVLGGQIRPTGAKGPRRSFSMDKESTLAAVNFVFFFLAGIMRDIV